MLEAFERFVPSITAGDVTPEQLIQACAELVKWCQAENSVFITDSYLPGFYYLYGRYSDAQIEAYNADLYTVLSSLRPLVVYVRSDVETALTRGVRQRGEQWLENITRYLNGWVLPLYGEEPKPLRTVPDVISFFTRVDRLVAPIHATKALPSQSKFHVALAGRVMTQRSAAERRWPDAQTLSNSERGPSCSHISARNDG